MQTARERIPEPEAKRLRFTIPMKPVPKARPRMTRNGHVYTPKRTRDFEAAVGWHALLARKKAGWEVIGDPVYLDVVFVRPPKNADLSNLLKAIEDAMNGVIWEDDVQVQGVVAWKEEYGKPRIEVEVIRL